MSPQPPQDKPCHPPDDRFEKLLDYLARREVQINGQIASEGLSGNSYKEALERSAQAEIIGVKCFAFNLNVDNGTPVQVEKISPNFALLERIDELSEELEDHSHHSNSKDAEIQHLKEREAKLVEASKNLYFSVCEFIYDWKKGDFQLSKLAQCDAASMMEASRRFQEMAKSLNLDEKGKV